MAGAKWRRQSTSSKRIERSTKKLSAAQARMRRYFTERPCSQCDPTEWVRIGDWEIHRANYHRPGGYQYEQRKAREQALKQAEKAMADAAKTAQKQAQRPKRPTNQGKTGAGRPTRGTTVTQPNAGTNGSPWTSPVAKPTAGQGGGQGAGQPQQTTATTEAIAELFRTWAQQVPPSIPASRMDAQATAEMWRQVADALRMRSRLEAELNKIPPDCLEPVELAARQASGLGDHHMEQVKRIANRYGEVATVLANPKTPNADYLKGGA